MTNKLILHIIKYLHLLYVSFFPKKFNFLPLENLNFRKGDFTNYKKLKLIIFNSDLINNDAEPSVYNFDFINYANKIGGKSGIEIANKNITDWQKKNKFKINKFWSTYSTSSRLINLIYNYDFITSISKSNKDSRLIQNNSKSY